MIKDSIRKLVLGQNLDESEITKTMFEIMEGRATSAQIASFLTALRIKGESVTDIYAAAKAMREKASKISTSIDTMDLCGTGGDELQTFNVSTTASFIVAGAVSQLQNMEIGGFPAVQGQPISWKLWE